MRLLRELQEFWQYDEDDATRVVMWVQERFDIHYGNDFTVENMDRNVKLKVLEIQKLHRMCVERDFYTHNSEAKEMRDRSIHVIRDARNLLVRMAALYHRLEPSWETFEVEIG